MAGVRVARRVLSARAMFRPLSLLTFVSIAACGAHPEAEEPVFRPGTAEVLDDGSVRIREDSLPFIEVSEVGSDAVPTLVRAPGRIAFRDGAVSEVGTAVDGRITDVHVRVGQRVAAGDPLVTIASPSAAEVRGQLAAARVTLAAAEAELARQEAMRDGGVGLASDLARASAAVAEARALLAALSASTRSIGRGSAASVVVGAPIAGTVLVRRATVGAAVSAGGEPLVTLGEPDAVWVVAQVFERELPLVEAGASARIHVPTLAEPILGTVTSVGAAVDEDTRRAPVYLALEAPTPSLRAGMFARTEIEVGSAGLGVPTSAVLVRDGGLTSVFVEMAERTYARRDVEVGAAVAGRAPVLSGLTRGERIVTRGALLLDGQAELLR
jgi:cobalt-zinc-cadmium efflux system membrane fusion protein